MAENYKTYNKLPQQDKESLIAATSVTSNQNESTLISNTDEVEGKLDTVNANLAAIIGKLDTIISNQGA